MFVLLTSILFVWRAAIASALACLVASAWIASMRHMPIMGAHSGAGDVAEWLLFAGSSTAIIAGVELIRRTVSKFARVGNANEWSSGIIFSLEEGQAWASWPGHSLPVRLGPQQEVKAMMEDFLAQVELARRLGRSAKLGGSPGGS